MLTAFIILALIGGCVVLCVDNVQLKQQLAEKEVKLLGPAGGPESGRTVIERLRQAGFTVLEKHVAPRTYMLGWLEVRQTKDSYFCNVCKSSFYELIEFVEDTNHSVGEALLVVFVSRAFFCNICGQVSNPSQKESNSAGCKTNNASSVFRNIRSDNMFDIIDYLQSQAGKMDSTIANWLAQRKQLLEREAARLGEALARYELGEGEDIPADGPFREIDSPEVESVPKMLERDKQKKE